MCQKAPRPRCQGEIQKDVQKSLQEFRQTDKAYKVALRALIESNDPADLPAYEEAYEKARTAKYELMRTLVGSEDPLGGRVPNDLETFRAAATKYEAEVRERAVRLADEFTNHPLTSLDPFYHMAQKDIGQQFHRVAVAEAVLYGLKGVEHRHQQYDYELYERAQAEYVEASTLLAQRLGYLRDYVSRWEEDNMAPEPSGDSSKISESLVVVTEQPDGTKQTVTHEGLSSASPIGVKEIEKHKALAAQSGGKVQLFNLRREEYEMGINYPRPEEWGPPPPYSYAAGDAIYGYRQYYDTGEMRTSQVHFDGEEAREKIEETRSFSAIRVDPYSLTSRGDRRTVGVRREMRETLEPLQ